jgi:hypothetical protein
MKYILFCILGMLFSCSKKQSNSISIDIGIEIFVFNQSGENLLLSSTPNFIKVDSLKLFYLVSGEKKEIYNKDMDCPRNICLTTDLGSERIIISPNFTESEEYPINYLQWENGDIDTIKCHIVRISEGESVTCDKVWYNDVLMFPENAIPNFGRAFKIVK